MVAGRRRTGLVNGADDGTSQMRWAEEAALAAELDLDDNDDAADDLPNALDADGARTGGVGVLPAGRAAWADRDTAGSAARGACVADAAVALLLIGVTLATGADTGDGIGALIAGAEAAAATSRCVFVATGAGTAGRCALPLAGIGIGMAAFCFALALLFVGVATAPFLTGADLTGAFLWMAPCPTPRTDLPVGFFAALTLGLLLVWVTDFLAGLALAGAFFALPVETAARFFAADCVLLFFLRMSIPSPPLSAACDQRTETGVFRRQPPRRITL